MQNKVNRYYKSGKKQLIVKHITENIDIYFKVFIIFIVGVCIGIVIINNLSEFEIQNITEYIQNSINALKNNVNISKIQVLKFSLLKNIVLVLTIWFFGLTFFGTYILYIITLIVGITFGYTVCTLMTYFTFIQGILFFSTGMLLQNIINIPSIIFLISQEIKTYKEFNLKKNINTKYIVVKNSAYTLITMIFLTIASFIEAYVSMGLVYTVVKYL